VDVFFSGQVGDGQSVRLSLLSFGGRLSADVDDSIMETPAKTCYEVGAVQVSDARYKISVTVSVDWVTIYSHHKSYVFPQISAK